MSKEELQGKATYIVEEHGLDLRYKSETNLILSRTEYERMRNNVTNVNT